MTYRKGTRPKNRPTYHDVGRVRLSIVRERSANGPAVSTAADIQRLFVDAVGRDPRECFLAFYLDTRHRIIALHVVSIGHAQGAPVHPREIFGPALIAHASAVVVAHNHPSGDPTPSGDDRLVTDRLRQAGDLLGVALLDHVVIGSGDSYFSFADDDRGEG